MMAAHLTSHLQQQHDLSQSFSTPSATAPSACDSSSSTEPFPPLFSNLFRPRSHRRTSVSTSTGESSISDEQVAPQPNRHRSSFLQKLSGPRGNAKRFLRRGTASATAGPPPLTLSMPRSARPRPVSEIVLSPRDAQMLATSTLNADGGRMRSDSSSTTASGPQPQPVVEQLHAPVGQESTEASFPPLPHEKTVATGSGISVGIALTEPMLFLAGYDQNDPTTKKSAILRGQLHLKVTKSVKIKKISVCFRGHAQTDWPDGT